jgi:hypothetical protein
MADEFVDEWSGKDITGLYFYQFFERRQQSALLYVSKYLDSIPSFDTNSNYLIINAKKKNILGDVPVKTNDVFFWIGAKSVNYERNYEIVIECLKHVKGQK